MKKGKTKTAAKKPAGGSAWKKTLKERVPVYGHRNWIVVADWAYPQQEQPRH